MLRDNEVGLNLRATRRYLLDCWSICMSTSVSVRAVVQPHRPDKEHRRHFGRVTGHSSNLAAQQKIELMCSACSFYQFFSSDFFSFPKYLLISKVHVY